MKRLLAWLLMGGTALAQGNINSYQPPQPFSNNFTARNSASGPTLLFSADLTSDLTASTGTNPTMDRDSTQYYSSTGSNFTSVGNDVAAFGRLFGQGSNVSNGLVLAQDMTNYLLQNNDITTTWTSVGSPTLSATGGAAAPDGGTSGLITANSNNEGITQTTSLTAANEDVGFTMWARCASGTVAFTVTIEGSTGGTPETSTFSYLATTSWKSFYIPGKEFTGSATGSVKVDITVDTSSEAISVWRPYLTQYNSSPNRSGPYLLPDYIPTTTTTATADFYTARLTASDLNDAYLTGTASLWLTTTMWQSLDQGTGLTSKGGNLFQIRTASSANALVLEIGGGTFGLRMFYNGSTALSLNENSGGWPLLEPGVPIHLVATWDQPNDTYRIYANGELAGETTSTVIAANDATFTQADLGKREMPGMFISRLKFYEGEASASFVSSLYDDEKTNYPYQEPITAPGGYTVLQFNLNEGSGNVFDEITGTELTANGNPGYSTSGTGMFQDLSGVAFDGTGDYFSNATGPSSADWGLTDGLIEAYINLGTTSGADTIIDTTNAGGEGYILTVDSSSQEVSYTVEADDGTRLSYGSGATAITESDHKIRAAYKYNIVIDVFVDGVSTGSASATSLNGKSVSTNEVHIGANRSGSAEWNGNIYWLRVSSGTGACDYVNVGGPGNG